MKWRVGSLFPHTKECMSILQLSLGRLLFKREKERVNEREEGTEKRRGWGKIEERKLISLMDDHLILFLSLEREKAEESTRERMNLIPSLSSPPDQLLFATQSKLIAGSLSVPPLPIFWINHHLPVPFIFPFTCDSNCVRLRGKNITSKLPVCPHNWQLRVKSERKKSFAFDWMKNY